MIKFATDAVKTRTYRIACPSQCEATMLGSALAANNGDWRTVGSNLWVTVNDSVEGGWDFDGLEKILQDEPRCISFSQVDPE
jgi:hypothetical protein